MANFIAVVVPMLISILHVAFIVMALGMPMALWEFFKAGQRTIMLSWGVPTLICIFMAIWGCPMIRAKWTAFVGGEKLPPKLIAYVMAGFFAPMLIPEPARWARKRLRHERGGRRRRRRSQ